VADYHFWLAVGILTQPKTLGGPLWHALDLSASRIIGAPPLRQCRLPKRCVFLNFFVPDVGAAFTPPTDYAKCNKIDACDFTKDAHFNNVIVAGIAFFSPPPVKDNWGASQSAAARCN